MENLQVRDYGQLLENKLGATNIIDQIEKQFDIFSREKINKESSELDILRTIKLFLHKGKEARKHLCQNTILSNRDCLTLAIITCLLANRKGFQVSIGRPKKLSRYLHALIIKKNGEMFKVTGKNRNYDITEIDVDTIMYRMKYMQPIITLIDHIKDELADIFSTNRH